MRARARKKKRQPSSSTCARTQRSPRSESNVAASSLLPACLCAPRPTSCAVPAHEPPDSRWRSGDETVNRVVRGVCRCTMLSGEQLGGACCVVDVTRKGWWGTAQGGGDGSGDACTPRCCEEDAVVTGERTGERGGGTDGMVYEVDLSVVKVRKSARSSVGARGRGGRKGSGGTEGNGHSRFRWVVVRNALCPLSRPFCFSLPLQPSWTCAWSSAQRRGAPVATEPCKNRKAAAAYACGPHHTTTTTALAVQFMCLLLPGHILLLRLQCHRRPPTSLPHSCVSCICSLPRRAPLARPEAFPLPPTHPQQTGHVATLVYADTPRYPARPHALARALPRKKLPSPPCQAPTPYSSRSQLCLLEALQQAVVWRLSKSTSKDVQRHVSSLSLWVTDHCSLPFARRPCCPPAVVFCRLAVCIRERQRRHSEVCVPLVQHWVWDPSRSWLNPTECRRPLSRYRRAGWGQRTDTGLCRGMERERGTLSLPSVWVSCSILVSLSRPRPRPPVLVSVDRQVCAPHPGPGHNLPNLHPAFQCLLFSLHH